MNISFWKRGRKLKPWSNRWFIFIFLGISLFCFIGFDLHCPSKFKRNPDLTLVTDIGDCRKPLWSPKSNDIFFLLNPESEEWGGLWKVTLGEEPQKLLEGTFLNFDISPDETKAVLVKGTEYTERSLVLYDIEKKTIQIIEISSKYPFDVSFSSKGNKIFYTISDKLGSYYSFWVKSFSNGEEKAIIESNVGSGDFDISPGDSLVIFRNACYDITSSPPQKISDGEHSVKLKFHPQKSNLIAMFSESRLLYVKDIIKNEVLDSIDIRPYKEPEFPDPPDWSPDGSKIVFSCNPPSGIGKHLPAELWIINNVDKYIK